jgi:hypothetical protein
MTTPCTVHDCVEPACTESAFAELCTYHWEDFMSSQDVATKRELIADEIRACESLEDVKLVLEKIFTNIDLRKSN